MKKMISTLAIAALALAGCGSREESFTDSDYVGVCINDAGQRVDDSQCSDDGSSLSGFFWGYLLANALMPSHGSYVTGYKRSVDTSRYNVYRGGVPRSGGYVDFNKYKPVSKTYSSTKSGTTSKSGSSQYKKSGGSTTYKAPKTSGGSGHKAGSSGGFKSSGGRR